MPEPSLARARWELQTTIVSTDSARRDSSSSVADITIGVSGGAVLELGTWLAAPSVATFVDSLPRIPVERSGRWLAASIATACRDQGALPSPLLVRLMAPRAATQWPARDSISYTTCTRGAPRRVMAVVTWQEPAFSSDGARYSQELLVSGRMAGDSTRAFPMRLTGTIEGSARIDVGVADGRLLRANGVLSTTVEASANALHQRAAQRLSYTATPKS